MDGERFAGSDRRRPDRRWRGSRAAERRVSVLGLGSLYQADLVPLVALGFDPAGCRRSRHDVPGMRCHAGEGQQDDFTSRMQILVCLLPLSDSAPLPESNPCGWGLVDRARG
jgi:glyoxylate/hydroxypyruvate reductase